MTPHNNEKSTNKTARLTIREAELKNNYSSWTHALLMKSHLLTTASLIKKKASAVYVNYI